MATYILEQVDPNNECCDDCSQRENACDPCGGPLEIWYQWGAGQNDLDTGTTFAGATVGYACGLTAPYMTYSGDDTSGGGAEYVTVDVAKAKTDGIWGATPGSDVIIQCKAGWFEPAGGSGSATLRVRYRGVERTKSISPGTQSGCASTSVGTITVYTDGTYSFPGSTLVP